ncbi:hypothetical protein HYT25_00385 [Candidatus Pacearchaeota archaeon]|nr:hypothetical protein [Candidatus Pacearchaeota archaeon]
MKKVFEKPYIYWIIGIFIFYLGLNFVLSGFYDTLKLIIVYADTVNWIKLGFSIILTLLIGFLVAINSVYFYLRYKERKDYRKAGTFTGVGAIGGLAIGICPLCITGLFPLLFGLFGITFSFASLPFQGVEIQVLVVIILLVSLWMLNRRKK